MLAHDIFGADRHRRAGRLSCWSRIRIAVTGFFLLATGCSSTGGADRAIKARQPCSSDVGSGMVLPEVRTAKATVPGRPFAVVTTSDGAWSFVSLGRSIGVFSNDSFVPRLVGQVPVPGQALGQALTSDGQYLIVADQGGVDVIDVAGATRGDSNSVVGVLRPPTDQIDGGAIEVALSRDDGYVFVTREKVNDLAVFNLRKARLEGYGPSAFVGSVPLGASPVGVARSPDGRFLYATSQAGGGPSTGRGGGSPVTRAPDEGTLSVIDVAKAVSDPAKSVVSTVVAGCNPVRVISSADGKTLWVTARASNALLGFSAAKARSDPHHALVARVQVGPAPVGVVLVRNGTRLIVANSNRFSATGSSANLIVVDTEAALRGREAVLGAIPTGTFPREFAVSSDGKVLFVTNYASAELQAVDVTTIP